LSELINKAPELASFVEYVEKAGATKTLDKKTKELMSLANRVMKIYESMLKY